MEERIVEANGLKICYDEFGASGNPAVLMIMGLGTQMIAWPIEFCERIAARGYRVIRFDNRDVGRSQKLEGAAPPSALRLFAASQLGLSIRVPYTLADMAEDAVGLLDTLGLARAHLVGASMGGMIAQLIAGIHPRRAMSLTSIMSTSGARSLPRASRQVHQQLVRPVEPGEDNYVKNAVRTWGLIGSSAYPPDEEELKTRLRASYRRSHYPLGFLRQFAAIMASGGREDMLRRLHVPTLVIHGKEDALVPVEGGIHTARLVPGARLELIDGMGHDLPRPLLPRLADFILEHIDDHHIQTA